jgi:hypothetical protein
MKSLTIDMITVFEILPNQDEVFIKTFGERTSYSQDMYVNVGIYPERMRVQIESKEKAFPVGKYFMKPSAITRAKYDKPELSPFELASHLFPLSFENK